MTLPPNRLIDEDDATDKTDESTDYRSRNQWGKLELAKALRRSNIIEDVSVVDGLVRVTLERSPKYITKKCSIQGVSLSYSNDTVQEFPYGFDMSGQIIEHRPSASALTQSSDGEPSVTVRCSVETESGCWQTTLLKVPLCVEDGSLDVDTNTARAGVEEIR